MSAWIVSKEHIDVMVKSILVHQGEGDTIGPYDQEMLDGIGRIFWRECHDSVAYRYPNDQDGDRPGPGGLTLAEIESYTYTDPGFEPTRGEAAKAFACFNYQSCEHPTYEKSEAFKQTDRIRRLLNDPEGEGPWGWDVEDVQARRSGKTPGEHRDW